MMRTWPMPSNMTEVFVDTSALFALLVETDENHEAARTAVPSLRDQDASLVTSSFVVLETVTLLQSRIGVAAVRIFYRDLLPLLKVVWIDEDLLHRSMSALLASSRRRVSITLMRERGIVHAFAFDDDFAMQGFELVSAGTRLPA